ncbi:MAG: TIGR01906 family membrane protein [Anaerolineales bacterium]|nr:TIGR01906 family membrane protein [Anaerolineales bacterium]
MQGWFPHTLRIVMTVAMPFVLVLSNVRLVLMPWFPTFEYNRPRFPADAYGFSTDVRKSHARRAVEYLLNAASIDYIAEERFEDGAPLYNERELRHMQDVKVVTGRVLWVWRGALLFALTAGVALARQPATRPLLRAGLMAGAAIVVVAVVVLLAYVLLNFNSFFTNFHRVFFESGSWMCSYSDTLIRLFPLRFWSDVALLIGGASLLEGVLLWWVAARFL